MGIFGSVEFTSFIHHVVHLCGEHCGNEFECILLVLTFREQAAECGFDLAWILSSDLITNGLPEDVAKNKSLLGRQAFDRIAAVSAGALPLALHVARLLQRGAAAQPSQPEQAMAETTRDTNCDRFGRNVASNVRAVSLHFRCCVRLTDRPLSCAAPARGYDMLDESEKRQAARPPGQRTARVRC